MAKEKIWEYALTDEDYYALTSRMTKEQKQSFDGGLRSGNTNFLMSLGATGFHKVVNANSKVKIEKDYEHWWNM